MSEAQPKSKRDPGDQVVIKKYANRRLYNTASSSYVTLDNLSDMVRQGIDFVVYDAKSGEDITRSVLAQIIFEEESRGHNLLPIQFLRQLIGFYGDSMQSVLPTYLEMSLDSFTRQQERFRTQFNKAFGAAPGMALFDETVSQNLALFDRAMRMFSPFAFSAAETAAGANPAAPSPASPAGKAADSPEMEDMKRQLEEMKAQIEKLAATR